MPKKTRQKTKSIRTKRTMPDTQKKRTRRFRPPMPDFPKALFPACRLCPSMNRIDVSTNRRADGSPFPLTAAHGRAILFP